MQASSDSRMAAAVCPKLRGRRQDLDDKFAQSVLPGRAGLEHVEVRRRLRPAAPLDRGREHDRGVAPLYTFDRGVGGAVAADHYHRLVPLDPIEADWNTVIECKADGGAIRQELRIDDARKRPGDVEIAAAKMEDDLLGGNRSHQRRKVHVQRAHRTPELVDIAKPKDLRR